MKQGHFVSRGAQLVNRILAPLNLVLERRNRYDDIQRKYIVRPSLIALALENTDSPVVVDVGAFIGNTIQKIVDVSPKATVFAFEPQPQLAKLINERFRSNSQITVYPCGVGAAKGTLQMHISDQPETSSFLPVTEFGRKSAPFAESNNLITADIISLDEWYAALPAPLEIIDLIKIDTQGFERFVVEGGQQVLSRTRYLMVEAAFKPVYENQLPFDALIGLLRKIGYDLEAVAAGYWDRNNGQLIEVDILLKRSV
jgi:FkbM family methyltransferase